MPQDSSQGFSSREVSQDTPPLDLTLFTDEQRRHLEVLKMHAAENVHDLFSPQELRRMKFLRWCIEHGKLTETPQ